MLFAALPVRILSSALPVPIHDGGLHEQMTFVLLTPNASDRSREELGESPLHHGPLHRMVGRHEFQRRALV